MFIFKRVSHLQEWVHQKRAEGASIGFIPTMGALHSGHLSLVEKSKSDCQATMVSIFVNPKQFNDPDDLIKYPRPVEKDIELLYNNGVDVLFLPEVEDIYPPGVATTIDFDAGEAAETMEGKFRPGHFDGMAEVVHRLLRITTPDMLFMGQKDYQQFSIIRKLIDDFALSVQLVMCPTVREENGLAMSSRNERLDLSVRQKAGLIHQLLSEGKTLFENGTSVADIRRKFFDTLEKADFKPEYFEVVDGYTLLPVETPDDAQQIVACCAVYAGEVRLIDNLIWKNS